MFLVKWWWCAIYRRRGPRILIRAFRPLLPIQVHKRAKVLLMVVSRYEAANDVGVAAMEELELQTREVLEGKQPTCNIFKQQYAVNLFSHNAAVLPNRLRKKEIS
ncbi:aspartate-semialdehyde dehydrogenase, NAD(P)-binding domain protein [Artemisia annua]|uniref:Aspartate-semialdehyde dehydrogenase, NAD(P)-binding domain protein n=1 Tax=Artemisia annua TaxID=35608 RepID=A0A2U1K831_ARTAN|nr:aspartate-semialdehyde dehydrogenase, NAD(P)-binding domain protein [Artemisia annua]